MGIERLYADGIEQAYQRGLKNPAQPAGPDFRMGSFMAAGFGGLGTGLLETGASFLEGVAGFQRYTDARKAEMGATVADPARRAEAQRGLDEAGRAVRRNAQENAPDPQMAHMADQVFHGLTRFGGKAVGAVVAAGPVGGAGLLGAEETNTVYRDLITRGIDSETALKVAAVQGVISAAGVVLPVSGAGMAATTTGKVAATAGLVAVGGPGSFVAQETLARDILQRAGYADEAAKHDPADLLGLGISTLLPGGFGAASLRSALRKRPGSSLEDVVKHIESGGNRYGKDGQLLTSPKGAQGEMQVMPGTATDPGFGVAPARDSSPDELARVGRDYLKAMTGRYEGDTDKALAAYNAGPGAVDAAVKKHGENWLAHMPAETRQYVTKANKLMGEAVADVAAQSPEVVDAARVKVLQETVHRSLPEAPEAYPRLMEAIDDVAAGRAPDTSPLPGYDFPLPRTLEDLPPPAQMADSLRTMAGGAFWEQRGGSILRDPTTAIDPYSPSAMFEGDVVGRTTWIPADEWFGRMRSQLGANGLSKQADIAAAVESAIEGRPLKARQQRTVDWMRQEADEINTRMRAAEFAPDEADMLARDAFDLGLSSRDAPDLAMVSRAAEKDPDAVERAAIMHEDDDAAFMAAIREVLGNDTTPEVPSSGAGRGGEAPRRAQDDAPTSAIPEPGQVGLDAPTPAQAPYPEATAPTRGAGPETAAGAADAGRTGADVQAARVAQQERQIVEALAAEQPDMMVALPGTNESVPLSEALEMIRAQQALDESDAALVRAAVLCDLSP